MTEDVITVEERARNAMHLFAEQVLRPFAREADRLGDIPPGVLRMPATLGLMHAFVPLRFGGGWRTDQNPADGFNLASSVLLRAAIAEEAATVDTALFISLPGPNLTATIIGEFATAQQQKRFFSSFCGETPRWAAFALTEPGAGSDISALNTTVREDNGEFVLNGRKWFVGNGTRADWFIVFATTAGGHGIFDLRALLVERDTPGVSANEVLPTMGLRALRVAELTLDHCRVPLANLLISANRAPFGSGFQAAIRTFQAFRPTVAALAIGAARAALAHIQALPGRLSSRAMARIGELQTRIQTGRLLYRRAALIYDQGGNNSKHAAMAKAFAAQIALDSVIEAMRLTGLGAAFAGSPLERLFRDALAFDLLEGTGDTMRLNISRELLHANIQHQVPAT